MALRDPSDIGRIGFIGHKRELLAFEQQALNEATRFIRDEVLLQAIDKLTAAVLTLVVLFAVVHVTIFLVLGGFAPRTDVSDDHGFGFTSARGGKWF